MQKVREEFPLKGTTLTPGKNFYAVHIADGSPNREVVKLDTNAAKSMSSLPYRSRSVSSI